MHGEFFVAGEVPSDSGRQDEVPPRPAQKLRGDFFVTSDMPSGRRRTEDEVQLRPAQKSQGDLFVIGEMRGDRYGIRY